MKKIKMLCLGAAVALMATTMPSFTTTAKAATQIVVSSTSGVTLEKAVKQAKSGDTIVVSGTVKSAGVELPEGVILAGTNNAVIDFSSSSSGQRGITISKNNCTVKYIQICNAKDNGIYITGSNNRLESLDIYDNADTGVQISEGGSNNYIYKVTSRLNADKSNGGENADGFAVKLHSGTGNILEECIAQNNSDDGYDLYAAHGAVTFKNCKALNNGNAYGIKGDGNGFKLGGVDNKTPGVAAHLDPLNHQLTGCIADGNTASGFDRNNQNGVVTMTNCTGSNNGKANFNFPATGTPSALGYKVTFGVAQIVSCTSSNGKNDISGAVVSGNSKGF